ncbi:glycosyltransferase [Luminiphilus sp.]|nr:glycosyltransferase [Luminiphilus sp.]
MNEEKTINKPLRVLHIGKYFPPHPGGMETYLRDLLNVQKRQGLDVMALVHASKRRLFDNEESVEALDGTTYQVMRSARWFNLGFIPISPGFIWSALKAIRNFKPDLIHIHHPNASAIWLLFLRCARKVPWIAHWHSDIVTSAAGCAVRSAYRIYRPWERRMLNRSSHIIATSPPYLAHSKSLAAYSEKCICVPLGLDELRLPDVAAVQAIARPPERLLLFVGRLAAYKGLGDLVDAMPNLNNVHCWIAGSGEFYDYISDQIISSRLQDRVKLLGAVSESEKWSLYQTCDALVLPSNEHTEAFGIVLLEAHYFGKPVVVTDTPGSGMSWVAEKIPKSSVARVNDPEDLAVAIERLFQLPNETGKWFSNPIFSLCDQSQKIRAAYLEALCHHHSHGAAND